MLNFLRRRCDPEVTVALFESDNGGIGVKILLSDCAVGYFSDTARKRGMSIEKAIGEALRTEQLLANRKLYVRTIWGVRQLISV